MKASAHAREDPQKSPPPPPPPPAPTRVLLTNDDGPRSPFFSAWVEHVRASLSWRAFAAPPAEGQSFVSKALATGTNHGSSSSSGSNSRSSSSGNKGKNGSSSSSTTGVFVTRIDQETVHVSGPPATAVNLSLHHLAEDCDLVVSGPNVGHNVGRGSVLSSGTVGAALEGAVAGRRAVALSFPFRNGYGNWSDEELRRAIEASGEVVRWLWENWSDGVDLYNVNVPLDFARERQGSGGSGGGSGGGEEEGGGSGGGSGGGEEEGGGGGEGTKTTTIPLSSPHFKVVTTTVDPRAQYSSLYTAASPDDEHDFEWGPSGLRVFEPAQKASSSSSSSSSSPSPFHPGGDVEAVARGHISVTPLRAALAHAEHEF